MVSATVLDPQYKRQREYYYRNRDEINRKQREKYAHDRRYRARKQWRAKLAADPDTRAAAKIKRIIAEEQD